jgi:hypothetical protein
MIQAHFSVDGVLSFRIEPIGGVGGHIPDNRVGLLRVNLPWAVRRLDAS